MMSTKTISIIVASSGKAIGLKGELPWYIPEDLKLFKQITSNVKSNGNRNAVIMGRKTWLSIPEKRRPLPGRLNVVISSRNGQEDDFKIPPEVLLVKSLDEAITTLSKDEQIENLFIIGGSQLYTEALDICDRIYLTKVSPLSDLAKKTVAEADAFFPIDVIELQEDFTTSSIPDFMEGKREVNGFEYEFLLLERTKSKRQKLVRENVPSSSYSSSNTTSNNNHHNNSTALVSGGNTNDDHEEYQYLKLVEEIIQKGTLKTDRTGVGTLSLFGRSMRFSLRDGTLPLLTTKQTFWRGLAEELLWFISGDTNAKTLQDKNVHIWDGNASREYLDKIGLKNREVGDLGPVYGFQWRHFGAEYKTCHDDYNGKGVDQLQQLIHTIKTNPNDRRMILSAWNPAAIPEMALPPCHMFAQFFVANGELSCQMYQRSADMGLGVPFNIASYALLTHLLAHCTGLKPGEFSHILGDAHVYSNHVEPLKEQLKRTPRPFPKLRIKTTNQDIDKFQYSDFEVIGYDPHPTIKMAMAV